MIVSKIVRGNMVDFATTFEDEDGNPVEPTSVELIVSYLNAAGERETVSIDMETNTAASEFVAEWDSSVAARGRVHWAIRATSPAAAEDGVFDLTANLANPEP